MMHSTLQAAPIFSDNMVLQRDAYVPVWGHGEEGALVTLSFGSARVSARVKGGVWKLRLPPHKAGERGDLEVSCGGERIRFKNVIFGDVWFAGGQSNMEMELKDCRDGKAEAAAADHPDIRFYQPVKRAFVDEAFLRDEGHCRWRECRPDTAAALSGAAYFFARKVKADTGVPIGIINCSWGGTSISAWMSREQLLKSAAGRRCVDDYEARISGKTDEQYEGEMNAYFEEWRAWDKRIQARRAKEPDVSWEILNAECGECPWPQPAGRKSPYCPANLYHSMIRHTAPYGLKGFLYYQGEEDESRAEDYAELMYYLIDQWRGDWGDDALPFLFVQLPMYASKTETDAGTVTENWPVLRENQYKVSRIVANTGMAVIIDCGEFDNIHPLDKQTVGFRLALLALQKVYGKPVTAEGPVFSHAVREGNALRVYFAHAGDGLEERGELQGFEAAGSDGMYRPASAVIEGATALVSAEGVAEPEEVRYCWMKYGPTPLFAKNGLPIMPFRSSRR
ncbi:MAG: sialate O-acetylesterase [Treponema sp.]|jgi:sialate O-acetylesterase|nr:sialate O-acetylesterase [Treponema sp.]